MGVGRVPSSGVTEQKCELGGHLPCVMQVGEKFPSKADPAYQYSEVLHKSFLFYYQQRSGKLPHQVCHLPLP